MTTRRGRDRRTPLREDAGIRLAKIIGENF
jgi:hypothetical protein